jgi:branched-chain amino acid transport system permease protein
MVFVFAFIVWLLMRSPWGRVIKSIREDEDAVRSLGKNVFAFKMQSLVVGGVLGAIGGVMFILPTSLQPDAMGRNMTFLIWTAMLLGGAATIFGPILGSIVFFALRLMVQGTMRLVVPDEILNIQQTEQFSWIMVGVALMLIVIFRPQGMIGNKKELNFNV